jgi:hypothetical protein
MKQPSISPEHVSMLSETLPVSLHIRLRHRFGSYQHRFCTVFATEHIIVAYCRDGVSAFAVNCQVIKSSHTQGDRDMAAREGMLDSHSATKRKKNFIDSRPCAEHRSGPAEVVAASVSTREEPQASFDSFPYRKRPYRHTNGIQDPSLNFSVQSGPSER